jgi:hypothetical protein
MQKDAQAFFVPMKAANSVAAKAAGVVSQCGTMIAVEIVPSVEVKIVNGKPVSKYVFASFLMPKMAQKDADRLFDEAKKANEAFASGMTPAELAEAEAMTVRPQVSNPME